MFKDASLLTFMLTSRGGWGCAKLDSVPKGRILYWSEWEVRRGNGLCVGKCYITLGLLPNTFSLLCRVGYVHCTGLRPYIPGRVGGDKPPRYNEALNMFSSYTCVIQEAF